MDIVFLVLKIFMGRLDGKYAAITGGSQGLGKALALDFAREDIERLSIIARHGAALEETENEIKKVSPKADVLSITADVKKPEDVERVVATTLSEFAGRLDVLVNNASTIGPSPMPLLVDYPLEDFHDVLETNLIAPFLFIQKFLPALIESKGSIINVTSDAGNHGYPGWGAYGISKFGIEGMSKTWAAELEGTGVRVNLVDPGDMNTVMHRAAEPDADPSQWARPENVTEVFLYLASNESDGITGKRFQAQADKWMKKVRSKQTGPLRQGPNVY
jgi:NAD(P)-dependent dehydrogenase (short-subunit alcohol dehydrogenase family)